VQPATESRSYHSQLADPESRRPRRPDMPFKLVFFKTDRVGYPGTRKRDDCPRFLPLLKDRESIKGLVSFEQSVRTYNGFAIGRTGIIYCPRPYLANLLLFGRSKFPFISSQNLLKLQFDYEISDKAALEVEEMLRKQFWDKELTLMNEYDYDRKTKRLEFLYSHSEIEKINARRKKLVKVMSLSE